MSAATKNDDLLTLTANIVASHVQSNEIQSADIPTLIKSVYQTLSDIGHEQVARGRVSIEDSVQADYIICLEDGKKLKMLKRHLRTHYGLTPEGYRKKWGLPSNYPMVAPNYADKRSELAKESGLGKHRFRIH